MSERTVVDVTRLASWPGRLTGIPRVISEYIRRASGDPAVVFVVWEHRTRRFEQVDPARTARLHGHGIQYLVRSTPFLRLASRLHYGGLGVISGRIRAFGLRRKSDRAIDVARRLERARYSERIVVEAGSGDTFVSFMGEWDDQAYTDAVVGVHDRGGAVVQLSYDLLPIVTPQSSGHSTDPMISYLSQVLPISALVVAISEHTKSDLLEWAQANDILVPRIEVFRLGDDFSVDRSDAAGRGNLPDSAARGEFILCVGTIEARKNHALLYYVYRLAQRRGIALPPLVIVGREGWRGSDIFNVLQEDPVIAGTVTVLDDVDDAGLAWLYRNCRFTIYPSMYEGWGLPIAESLAWGKPVLTSRSSSMPEIAGDLIDYFDPFSVEECLEAILALSDDDKLADATARVAQYKPTLWADSVEELDRLIRSAEARR